MTVAVPRKGDFFFARGYGRTDGYTITKQALTQQVWVYLKVAMTIRELQEVRYPTMSMNNDNGISRIEINNVTLNNVNDNVNSEKRTERIAEYILQKLSAPEENRKFYLKVAWRLSEATITRNIEIALAKGRNPQKYFTWLCNREM